MKCGTYAEINLDNLAWNLRGIRERVGDCGVIPVIKADAYGHGAVVVAGRLVREGCSMFAVARFEEAMELRESGISTPILVLGRLFPDQIIEAVKAGLTISIFDPEDLDWIEAVLRRLPGLSVRVHLKLDSGMGRVGLLLPRAAELFDRLSKCGGCDWEGLYTHFSTADEQDKSYAHLQLARFGKAISLLSGLGKKPRIIHMAASGAILDLPESYFDAVRPGILMYGHYPSKETSRCISPRQVMSFKTYVAHLREMPGGHPVSYGRRWTTPGQTRIAVLPVGYADGLSRRFTNNGEVLIRGRRYPMVGTVTMDYIMVNVGGGPVAVGDEVLLWGETAEGSIQTLEVAERIGTIPYELTCGLSRRVSRVYVGDAG
ncbi:MAG: alanine racemase [Syntrophobacteraceae bacterium]|nr:alanine racemase [Syntrophobacteraceae bacterium]